MAGQQLAVHDHACQGHQERHHAEQKTAEGSERLVEEQLGVWVGAGA
jgi:hypothetical protein